MDNQSIRRPLNTEPLLRNVRIYTADRKAEKSLELYLKEIGPSRAVERFLSGYGKPRTRCAYAMELMMYRRWLVAEGVALGWDDLPRDNLRRIFESEPTDVEAKRTHMDWLRRYLNVYLIGKDYSESKRKIASAVVRGFYEANDSALFGHLKEAEQKARPAPKPLEAEDIRKVLLAMLGLIFQFVENIAGTDFCIFALVMLFVYEVGFFLLAGLAPVVPVSYTLLAALPPFLVIIGALLYGWAKSTKEKK